jgi:hypothetical protein
MDESIQVSVQEGTATLTGTVQDDAEAAGRGEKRL